MSKITIQNRLEVGPGNKITVPGCEPLSSFTSVTVLENRKCGCTQVDLADALEAIPGSTLEMICNQGHLHRRFYFVLPEGPPPRTGCVNTTSVDDYYQILRDICDPFDGEKSIKEVDIDRTVPGPACDQFPEREISVGQICEGFPLRGIFE